jgi:hypothetical protein
VDLGGPISNFMNKNRFRVHHRGGASQRRVDIQSLKAFLFPVVDKSTEILNPDEIDHLFHKKLRHTRIA